MNRTYFYILSCVLFSVLSNYALADDPGITKVRLIQQSDTSYVLEADVPQNLLSLIKPPVFPSRFRLSNADFENQSGWLTVKISIVTSGDPLTSDEEILLPWLRNGVDFTALWMDGSTYKGLFNRSLNGIHIPMNEVMPVLKTQGEVFRESFILGLKHLVFRLIHPLLIIVLAWYYKSNKAISVLLWYSLGQAVSMVFVEVGNLQLDVLFSDMLLVFVIFFLAYSNVTNRALRYGWIAMLVCGLTHGLASGSEIATENFEGIQHVQSLFAFNLAIDIVQYALLGLSLTLFRRNAIHIRIEKWMAHFFGGLAVCLIILLFNNHIWIGDNHILNLSDKKYSISIPVAGKPAVGPTQRGASMMVTPIMSFLSVEPFEIRQEILIRAELGSRLIDADNTSNVISTPAQEQLKSEMIRMIKEQSRLYINEQSLLPAVESANFVKLSRGGVTILERVDDENINEGILGVTLTYDIPAFPDSILWDWQFFPEGVEEIEASVVDTYGATTLMWNREDHILKWGNRLGNMKVPMVEPVEIKKYPAPWVSFIIFFFVFIWVIVNGTRKKSFRLDWWVRLFLIISFVSYPYIRTYSALPLMSEWKPSKERTSIILNDLISNVYRAFDRRKESDVYDRLSMSVTGDQLTEIYLQNRQAMALESRGGARAIVDEVNILEVLGIERGKENGFIADAVWTIRGSVNHFGHTHYRQNKNRGLITFVKDMGVWKISSIEMIDEHRVF